MGPAISPLASIQKLVSKTTVAEIETAPKLSSLRKPEIRWHVDTLIHNRPVGESFSAILQEVVINGHDLQLNGGRNHGTWLHNFEQWSPERVRVEIEAGQKLFANIVDFKPAIFSALGWRSDPRLLDILAQQGFFGSADWHGDRHAQINQQNGLVTIPTHMTGEPGGIGYLEYLVASQQSFFPGLLNSRHYKTWSQLL